MLPKSIKFNDISSASGVEKDKVEMINFQGVKKWVRYLPRSEDRPLRVPVQYLN